MPLTTDDVARAREELDRCFERGLLNEDTRYTLARLLRALAPHQSSLKDEGPGRGTEASGSEGTGCCPLASTSTREDTPREQPATTWCKCGQRPAHLVVNHH